MSHEDINSEVKQAVKKISNNKSVVRCGFEDLLLYSSDYLRVQPPRSKRLRPADEQVETVLGRAGVDFGPTTLTSYATQVHLDTGVISVNGFVRKLSARAQEYLRIASIITGTNASGHFCVMVAARVLPATDVGQGGAYGHLLFGRNRYAVQQEEEVLVIQLQAACVAPVAAIRWDRASSGTVLYCFL